MKKIILFILFSIFIFSYYIENNKVYYNEKLIKNADVQTFKVYKKSKELREGVLSYDSEDKNCLYYYGEIIFIKQQ